MKILWSSVAPWVGTGYGMQTALFAPRLKAAGHDLAIAALYGVDGSRMEWNGLRVYPSCEGRAPAMLPFYAQNHAGGECDPANVLVLTLYDVWPMVNPEFAKLRMASWVPVDHYPVPPRVRGFFTETGARPIAMSRFGEQALRDVGLDPLYVPHAVDTTVMRPDDALGMAARRGMKVPDDAFVVGMVANNKGNNPPRKAFPQVFQAFAEFHRRHPDTYLYLHADLFGIDHGVDLFDLAAAVGIPVEAVRTVNQMELQLGIEQEKMNAVFNAFDVLASPSYGEGFGIPIIEAQACGVPVIVTDWTAMPELCGAGWKVGGDPFYDAGHDAFFMCPSVGEILQALEEAYEARGDQALKDGAREFALGYDVETVMAEHWVPVLDALDRPREVPPLTWNRAQRRAAAKAKVTA